jgi:hypothetical protein
MVFPEIIGMYKEPCSIASHVQTFLSLNSFSYEIIAGPETWMTIRTSTQTLHFTFAALQLGTVCSQQCIRVRGGFRILTMGIQNFKWQKSK